MNTSYRKLILGTAQLGLDYGIQNTHGKLSQTDSEKILEVAQKHFVTFLDTAYSYGTSEETIGLYMKKTHFPFSVVSKTPDVPQHRLQALMQESLKRLGISTFYGYLIHNMDSYRSNNAIYDELLLAKDKGLTQKTGFSLYFPKDLELLLESRIPIDIIQIPLNCFDHRFVPYLSDLKNRNIEIHVRSVFLQGIIHKNPDVLPSFFDPLKEKIRMLQSLAQTHGISVTALCMRFVASQKEIDKIIIGVHSADDLLEDIKTYQRIKQTKSDFSVDQLEITDERIILPIYWPKI